jgi:colanic acid/amylovoran biosynthesis glycosyltransferase
MVASNDSVPAPVRFKNDKLMDERIKVIRYTPCWLPQTMTWVYTHTQFLPDDFESFVVCKWSENLDQFRVKNLASLETPPRPETVFQKIQRRLGLSNEDEGTLALLEKVIQEVKPNILHSHFGNCGWANSKVAKKYDVRQVVTFHGLDLSYLPRVDSRWISRYREMSDRVDLVLCEGPHMARCVADLGVDRAKIKLFRLGIDLDRIPFVPRSNHSGEAKRFLIAGSFREKKGIPYALEALGLLSKAHPNIEITVIGDSLGSEREEAEKRRILDVTERYGLHSRTRFLGYQPYDTVIREFYKHDVFVSPSVTSSDGDTEGGAPVTVIEAAASGMPVISTLHCDIPFVLSEENGVYLVSERSASGLAGAIERLLQCRDWNPIVSANRRLVEQELDVRRQTEKLACIYRELSSQSKLATEALSSASSRSSSTCHQAS